MARVTCEKCGLSYDDVYRLTYCPHAEFAMRTMAYRGGESKLCTTVEELNEFLAGDGD